MVNFGAEHCLAVFTYGTSNPAVVDPEIIRGAVKIFSNIKLFILNRVINYYLYQYKAQMGLFTLLTLLTPDLLL